MKRALATLLLVAMLVLATASAALAGKPADPGSNGLEIACGNSAVAAYNPNCGGF